MDANTLQAALAIKTPEDVAKLLLENERLRADNETLSSAVSSAWSELGNHPENCALGESIRLKLLTVDAYIERERDHLRAEISRYIELAAILRDELERVKREVCDLAAERDQLLGQRAALLELLSEIRPEIEMLREKCGYHWGTEPRCNDCQEYAHLDSWLDRSGHLMSDLLPEEVQQ